MKKSVRNKSKAIFLTGALCLAVLGGVSAYLTDYDKADNQFTVGKVEIELEERDGNRKNIRRSNREKK